jgi:hypothetical protein
MSIDWDDVLGENEEVTSSEPEAEPIPAWQSKLKTEMGQVLRKIAPMMGYQDYAFDAQLIQDFDHLLNWLGPYVATDYDYQRWLDSLPAGIRAAEDFPPTLAEAAMRGDIGMELGGKLNPFNLQAKQHIFDLSKVWATERYGIPPDLWAKVTSTGSGSTGPTGPRKPTEKEIRDQFDMDELSDAVTGMGRAYLVDELPNSRDIAKAYVDEVVAVRAQKEIDFETFVKKRLKGTSRWQQIYRNKPKGVDELEFLKPYVQAATMAMGGGDDTSSISDVVAGGAALGASQASFSSRLMKERKVQTGSGFISNLEARVSNISNLLRG